MAEFQIFALETQGSIPSRVTTYDGTVVYHDCIRMIFDIEGKSLYA